MHEARIRRRLRVVRRRGRPAAVARAVGGALRHPQPAPHRDCRTATPTSSRASGARGCWCRPTCPARRACSGGSAAAAPRSPARCAASSSGPSARAPSRWPGGRCCACPATDPGADSIERHLAECFGTEVRVGVLLGTRRVNQKPVLQVFDLDGTAPGLRQGRAQRPDRRARPARGGVAGHGRRAAALAPSGLPGCSTTGSWAGLEVLVISALATDPRQPVTRDRAARRDARGGAAWPDTTSAPLADSGFWAPAPRRRRAARPRQPDGGRLRGRCRRDRASATAPTR